MKTKFLIIILGSMVINYLLRALPILSHNGKQPGKFVKSFLEYTPYAALGALLFPDVLYSAGSIGISVSGILFAGILIILKQNMVIVVSGTIFLVYGLTMFLH
jgi:branched-subunit amino acid transport protein